MLISLPTHTHTHSDISCNWVRCFSWVFTVSVIICIMHWLFSQALLASGYSQGNYEQSRQVIYRVLQVYTIILTFMSLPLWTGFDFPPKEQTWKLTKYFYAFVLQIGLVSGIALAVILFLGFGAFSSLFTTDLEVLTIAWSGILVRNFRSESLIIGQLFTFWIEAENDHCLCSFEVSCYQTKVFSPFRSSKI